MSVAIAPDRKQESDENITGAPDIAAQQIREHQAASQSSSQQQHVGDQIGQQQQSGPSKISSEQINENKGGQNQTKS